MSSITQEMKFRLSLVKSYQRNGATKTAIRYKTTRQLVYFWAKRFDGDIHSLADHSHQPHSHPKQHTDEELKWIRDMRRRSPDMGLVDFWLALRRRHAYKRNIASLFRVMRNLACSHVPSNARNISISPMPQPYTLVRRSKSTLNMSPRSAVSALWQAPGSINSRPSTNIPVSAISRSSMNTVPIPRPNFSFTARISSSLPSHVSKRITGMSSLFACEVTG
jgi:hypothetical protein